MNRLFFFIVVFLVGNVYGQDSDDNDGLYIRYNYEKNGNYINLEKLFSLKPEFNCETDKYKRFIDKKTGLIGLVDKDNTVIIEAKYNGLSMVYNGLIIALKSTSQTG